MKFTKEQWNDEKRRLIESDDSFEFKKSPSGGYQQGICPSCGRKSVWIGSGLVTVQCNHQNACGFETSVKELYPDIHKNLCQKFAASPEDPLGKAKIYLTQRGFDLKLIDGWYSQEAARCDSDNQFYPTVRFGIDRSNNISWERLIDCRQKHKANFIGKYGGLAWIPSDLDLELCGRQQVWIVEGIFDAISLLQSGILAIATLSTNNFPTTIFERCKGCKIEWVIAFDNDPVHPRTGKNAGLEAARKFAKKLDELGESYKVAFPPAGKDWNDLFRSRELSNGSMEDAFRRGKLLFASSPDEHGFYLSQKYNGLQVFEFGNKLYGWHPLVMELDEQGNVQQSVEFDAARQHIKLDRLSTFGLSYQYCLKNARTKKTTYFFRVSLPGSTSYQIELDSSEIVERGPFRKALSRECPGAIFKADQFWLDIMTEQWFRKRTNIVDVLPWNGYDPASKCYIFREIAYDEHGRHYLPNQHGYFDLPNGTKIKPDTEIVMKFEESLNLSWFKDYAFSFGYNGLISLAFWSASLFAEQFRREKKSFPFLAVVGQPGTGKSTMLEFLWRLYGRDEGGAGYEGIPLTDASTKVGFYRMMEQVSNLPTVFIEDKETEENRSKKFDYEHFKASYNGRILRVTGKATQGNETHTPKFRSTIVVGQNAKVDGSQALRERFIELCFDKSNFTTQSWESALRIEKLQTKDLCGYRHHLLKNQSRYLKILFESYEDGLNWLIESGKKHSKGPLKNNRITHNYALVYGGGKLLLDIFKGFTPMLWESFTKELLSLALDRQESVAVDSHLIQIFFQTFEYFLEEGIEINHFASSDKQIAIRLEEFSAICGKRDIRYFKDEQQLRRELKNSNYYKFVKNDSVYSKKLQRSVRLWVFDKPAGTFVGS